MAKNPLITDDVRGIIYEVYKDNMDCPAKQIRDKVEVILRNKKILIKQGWPGISTIQKELKKIRAKEKTKPPEQHRLDGPWSIGCLSEYPIPPDALPKLKKIYKASLEGKGSTITVRQALWIARLHNIVDETSLRSFAEGYALQEQIDWLLGRTPNTRELDLALMEGSAYSIRAIKSKDKKELVYILNKNDEAIVKNKSIIDMEVSR